jgi:hypothetical protein
MWKRLRGMGHGHDRRALAVLRQELVFSMLVVLAQAAMPIALGAQEFRGRVLEEGSGAPASGAFLTLLDSAGGRADATLSGETGTFVLTAPAAGAYTVRIERIGYRTWTSPVVELTMGTSVSRIFRVPIQAVTLSNLSVRVGEECRGSPGSSERLLTLWTEARKALRVTAWSEGGRLELNVRRFERDLDPKTGKVVAQSETSTIKRSHSAFTTLPPDTLSADGYVRGDTLLAPDADVLLSPSFAADHCFGVERSRESDGLVGLAFRPVPDRRVPDVSGVLWLDSRTAALRAADFRYTGLVLPFGADSARGHLTFERLPDGAWLVSRWSVRAPVNEGAARRPRVTRGRRMSRVRWRWNLAAYHEEGGEVVSARLPDGRTVALGPSGYISGVAYQEKLGHLLPGAEVSLAGTVYEDTTDAFGGFRVGPMPPGEYHLVVRGGSDGSAEAEADVKVRDREDERLELVARRPEVAAAGAAGSSAAEVGPAAASGPVAGEGSVTLLGLVRDSASGQGLGSLHVRALGTGREAVTNEQGFFVLKGLRSGPLRLEIGLADRRTDTALVRLTRGRTGFATLDVAGAPRLLPDVRVAVRGSVRRLGLAGFYQRMAHGSGYYLVGDKIEEKGMRSALRSLPGVKVTPCHGSGGMISVGCETISVGRGPGLCSPRIIVNGSPMIGVDAEYLLDLDPAGVAGIEVYPDPAMAPVQYRNLESRCGVLMVWTK